MPVHFSESRTILATLRSGQTLAYATLAFVLLVAWLYWITQIKVSVWIASREARVETANEPYVVRSPVQGVLADASLRLGQTVREGELLFRLDSREKTAEVRELEALIEADLLRLRALDAQFASELSVQDAEMRAAKRAREKAEVSQSEAARQAEYFREKYERLQSLSRTGAAADDDVRQSLFDLERERTAAHTLRLEAEVQRLAQTKTLRSSTAKRHENEALRLELAAKVETNRARRDRILFEIERYELRSPIAGVIGEVRALSPRSTIAAQEVLATIIPDGHLRIVAHYSGREGAGLLHATQLGRVRLSAFPWTHYGVVRTRVTQVSQPTRGADLRVEAEILSVPPSIELYHGMVGTLETSVDDVTPLALVLRALGKWSEQQP